MLSRAAESLYWTSRYIERAEDITRLLDVNFHALLDAPAAEHRASWQQLVKIGTDDGAYHEHFSDFTARPVTEFLLWHRANPYAVTTCIALARENARSVRELITREMWEQINKLYFLVRDVDRAAALAGPHEFFRRVREGSHAFQGVTTATMPHGEGFQFVQVGTHLERADKTLRILDVKNAALEDVPPDSLAASTRLVALLKSCSAFEAFRKSRTIQLEPVGVADYLLLDRSFPRSVLFCLERCLDAINAISAQRNGPHHSLGRLCAELSYTQIDEVAARPLTTYLAELLGRMNRIGEEISRTYFSTQVLAAEPVMQHHQQQQQQQREVT
jgi:uncharacterized alpha-E superfamily protein